ncbi:MAG TPA: CBS domain-containing protein [Coleofasciculaceae cyanobacterium]|jgi:CBS domain-containing protein
MQKASELMTQNPHCCLPESTVMEAVEVMAGEDCGAVPVIDHEGHCVGMITDRDVCLRVVSRHLDPEKTRLQAVMTHGPITCNLDEPMDSVVRKMEQRMVRRIPVVDQNNLCVGIISEADIATKEEDRTIVSEFVEVVSHQKGASWLKQA